MLRFEDPVKHPQHFYAIDPEDPSILDAGDGTLLLRRPLGRANGQMMLGNMHIHAQEPPPCPTATIVSFLVGQDGEGHWLAVETHGLGGGIFKSRDKAVQYAREESHRLPGAVRVVDEPIRLFVS